MFQTIEQTITNDAIWKTFCCTEQALAQVKHITITRADSWPTRFKIATDISLLSSLYTNTLSSHQLEENCLTDM